MGAGMALRKTSVNGSPSVGGSSSSGMDADSAERIKEAAEVIAAGARQNASSFSKRIPAATKAVGDSATKAHVITSGAQAPNAAPFEYAERHPLFGNKKHWYTQPHRPYMERAGRDDLDEAAEAYSEVFDDWAARLGYK